MLSLEDVYSLQSKKVADLGTDEGVTFQEYVATCRKYTTDVTGKSQLSGLTSEARVQKLIESISTFVHKYKVKVKGYYADTGIMNYQKLLQDVIEEITGLGILKKAFEDENIDEIQINDYKTIFVSRNGVTEPYLDEKGRPYQFSDDVAITTLLSRILNDDSGDIPLLTVGNPIINAKTAKQHYRVNAVHNSANARDKTPWDFPATSIVIRKFKQVSLTLEKMIETGSLTESMGRLVKLIGRAGLRTFCVGATGSGKTTLLNVIANNIPMNRRIILIQDPTEIYLSDRDEQGINKRNAVHWEVKDTDKVEDGGSSATLSNLISNTLRQTPEIILIGEARRPPEFKQIIRLSKMGHPILGTFHADGAYRALERVAEELGGSESDLRKVCDSIDFIIAQHRFLDGTRKIMEISEINGILPNGTPNINTIFKYKLSGKMSKNPVNGMVVPDGEFIKVGKLSDETRYKFYLYNIGIEELEEFC